MHGQFDKWLFQSDDLQMWKLDGLKLVWIWKKWFMSVWKIIYMQSIKDWHTKGARKEKINRKKNG